MAHNRQQRLLVPSSASSGEAAAVVCGAFCDDGCSRAEFLARLQGKMHEANWRDAEGFPLGDDGDVLSLSDPPYFTSCPNPFFGEVIEHFGRPYDPAEEYNCEPFAADVAASRTTPSTWPTATTRRCRTGHSPLHPPLHEAWGCRPGRFLRIGHDRRGGDPLL